MQTYSQVMEMLSDLEDRKIKCFMIAEGVVVSYDGDGYAIHEDWRWRMNLNDNEAVCYAKTKKDMMKFVMEYYQSGWSR